MPDALVRAGANVVVHQQHVTNQPGIADSEWIAEIAKHDWVVLTKDKSFKRRELKRQAIMAVTALPRIRRLCATHAGPFIARITRMAEVDIVLRPKK